MSVACLRTYIIIKALLGLRKGGGGVGRMVGW